MNFQQNLVFLLFAGALVYIGIRTFSAIGKKQCNKGCAGTCGKEKGLDKQDPSPFQQ
jgi:hypothetical protein